MIRNAYPKYKSSGVEWLGEVPDHWATKRLKYSAQLINEKVEARDTDLPYIGLEHIESWTGKRIVTAEPLSSEGQSNRIRQGDVLFGKLRPYLAKALRASEESICTGELLVLKPKWVIQDFLFYYMLSKDFISVVDSSTYGAKMPRASWEFIGNLPTLVPSQDEQRSIAAFLDRETGRIDAMTEKKQRQVELLQEKRAALISRAVTRGLNPAVPLKDSGIDWLGHIPAHWGLKRIKFLAAEPLKYGANESAEIDDPDLPRYIRITDIDESGSLREETFRSLPESVAEPFLLEPGDLLFARSGATVGKTFMYRESWGRACYAGYLIRLRTRPMEAIPEFITFFTASSSYWGWLSSVYIQATIQNVSAEKYANLTLVKPPIDEQASIVSFLDQETAKIDALIAKIQEGIDRLKEYRTALISAAVTGKIDVRGEISGQGAENAEA